MDGLQSPTTRKWPTHGYWDGTQETPTFMTIGVSSPGQDELELRARWRYWCVFCAFAVFGAKINTTDRRHPKPTDRRWLAAAWNDRRRFGGFLLRCCWCRTISAHAVVWSQVAGEHNRKANDGKPVFGSPVAEDGEWMSRHFVAFLEFNVNNLRGLGSPS